jgi:hypothetical protein
MGFTISKATSKWAELSFWVLTHTPVVSYCIGSGVLSIRMGNILGRLRGCHVEYYLAKSYRYLKNGKSQLQEIEMKYISRNIKSGIFLIFLTLTITGCALSVDRFDNLAYQNATSLKVDSLALMGKATQSYSTHEGSVEALKVSIEKAYEYANGRPKNREVAEQWELMKDPDNNLLGGFLVRWKDKDKLSDIFVDEAKKLISSGFDQIIGLESGKIKPKGNK